MFLLSVHHPDTVHFLPWLLTVSVLLLRGQPLTFRREKDQGASWVSQSPAEGNVKSSGPATAFAPRLSAHLAFQADSTALSLGVWIFATSWTLALQAPLSMGFFRQGPWSGLPFPPPEAFHYPGMEPAFPVSCVAGRFFTHLGNWGGTSRLKKTLKIHYFKTCRRVK